MSNWREFLFLYFIFSSVIAPSMAYATYSYEPSDILGWVSKALLAITSFCCVVVFTPSIIFIYFYHWLYRKHCSRKAARQESSKLTLYHIPVPDAKDTKVSSFVDSPDSLEEKTCENFNEE